MYIYICYYALVQHWIDSLFLAQVTYTCVSVSAGGHAACSAPYSLRFLVLRTLVAPESSAKHDFALKRHENSDEFSRHNAQHT